MPLQKGGDGREKIEKKGCFRGYGFWSQTRLWRVNAELTLGG